MATSPFEARFDTRHADASEDEIAAVIAVLQAYLAQSEQTAQQPENLWSLAGRREAQGLPVDGEWRPAAARIFASTRLY